MYLNKSLAECLGTFIMVFAGCAAIIVNDQTGTLSHVGVSLVFGLVVMAMIYSIGNISGAHINPAVTIAFFLSGRLNAQLLLPFLLAQIIGAILAGIVLRLLFPEHVSLGATLPSGSYHQTFVLEMILSFVLMFVILNVSTGHKEKGIMAGVAVGGTVAFEALLGGPISGASMNPARSIGPALVSGQISGLWLYLAAPTLGMICAAPFCRWVQGPQCCSREAEHAS